MKVYIWKSEGKVTTLNFLHLAHATLFRDDCPTGWAAYAFLRKKDAIEFIEKQIDAEYREQFELLTVEI